MFGPGASTEEVYKAMAEEIVDEALRGINGTVFAYGQTSSGKTYTMRGCSKEPGMVGLSIRQIFSRIQERSDEEFLLRLSYFEIYQEKVRDLLSCEERALNVRGAGNAAGGCYVEGLQEEVVVSAEQVEALLDEGDSRRAVGATKMNEHSSRSHAVMRMVVETRQKDGKVSVATINMVDLAGSERLSKTKAEGTRAKEGAQINKSLLVLGQVIRKLSAGGTGGEHVPYRDSVLTRLLQTALGGNSRTCVVCAVSPAIDNSDETLSTLKFASQAKMVCNRVSVNCIQDDQALLQHYRTQLENMSQEVEKLKTQQSGSGPLVQDLQQQLAQKEDEINRMRSLILTSRSVGRKADGARMLHMETWCAGEEDAVGANTSMSKIRVGSLTQDFARMVIPPSGPKQQQVAAAEEKKKVAEAMEKVSALEKRVKELEGELEDARELQEALEEDNKQLDGRLKAQSLKIEGEEHASKESKERITFLVETLQLTEDQLVELRREVELAKAKAMQAEARAADADREKAELVTKLASVGSVEEKAMRVEELELEVQALKWEREQAQQQKDQLMEQHGAVEAELREQLEEERRRAEEATSALEARDGRLEELEAELGEVVARGRAEGGKAEQLSRALMEMEAKLRASEAENKRKDEEMAGLKERLRVSDEAMRQEAVATETQMAAVQKQIRSVASVREKIKALSGEVGDDDFKQRWERATQESVQLRRQIQETEAQLELAKQRSKTVEKELDETKKQLEKAKIRIGVLEKEVVQMEEEVEQMENEVRKSKDATTTGKEQKVRELESEIEKIKQQVKAAEDKAARELKTKLDKVTRDADVIKEQKEQKIREMDTELTKLRQQLKMAEEKASRELKARVDKTSQEADAAKEQRAQMVKDLEQAKKALEERDRLLEEERQKWDLEIVKRDKKLVQLKELAMEKAKEKLKERDAIILRLKKEKARLQQERDEQMESVVRQHQSETEELQKQLQAKSDALQLMRGLVQELERADENATETQQVAKQKIRKETLLKLHQNFG